MTGVLGLSTLGVNAGAPSVPKLTGYFPKEFVKVYNGATPAPARARRWPCSPRATSPPTIKDLRLAESKQSLPQTPVSLVYAGPKSNDTSGADEWDLDTQTSTGVAPRASRLYIYVATSLS